MKRLISLALALLLFALPALAEPMGYLDYTDDILADGSPIYYFPELSLKLPADWQGKVMALREDGGTSFYQKASYEKYQAEGIDGGGFLFQLGASVNGSFSRLPAFEYLGFSEESAMNYYLELPTDYPAYMGDEAVRAEYDAMLAEIDTVVANAEFYAQGGDAVESGTTGPDDAAETASEEASGVTLEQARYHFEHSALPRYFYDDPENMLAVLADAGAYRLWQSLADENGVAYPYTEADYAQTFLSTDDGATILRIDMPRPEATTLCYRVYMVYSPNTGATGYYTVEYDDLLTESAFLCGWTAAHEHANYGSAAVLDGSNDQVALLAEASQVAALAGVSPSLSPSGGAPSGNDAARLVEIPCPELGFTTMADPAYSWDYQDGTGITIYTESAGSIPYVIVWRSEDLIVEPLDYIKEQYTPHIRQQYGDDLVAYVEYETYDVGGKQLPAGLYTYRLQGYLIDLLRLYDSTGDRTVAYTAKYIQGDGDATLAALGAAIRNFRAS